MVQSIRDPDDLVLHSVNGLIEDGGTLCMQMISPGFQEILVSPKSQGVVNVPGSQTYDFWMNGYHNFDTGWADQCPEELHCSHTRECGTGQRGKGGREQTPSVKIWENLPP